MRYSNYLFMSMFFLLPLNCFSFFETLTNFLFHKKTCSQLQSSKRETAIKNLKKKQIDTPLDPIVNYNLGITQYQEEAFESASNNFERAFTQSNDKPELQAQAALNAGTSYHAHAASLYEKKELDQALVKIDKALAWYSRLFASEKNQAIIAQKQEHAEQLKKKIEEEKKNQDQEKNKDNKNNNQQDKQDQENQQQNQNNNQDKQNQENSDQKDQQQNQDKQENTDQKENQDKSDSKQDQSNNDQNKEDKSLKDQNKNNAEQEKQPKQDKDKDKGKDKEEKNQKSATEEKEQEAKKAEESAAKEEIANEENKASDQPKKETLQQKRMRALIESLDQQEGDMQKEYLKRKTAISSQPTMRGQKTW